MAVEFNSTQFSELHMAGSVSVINVTGTAFVSGDLHISNYGYSTGFLNGGQINVNGNLYSDGAATGVDVGMRGTTLINMVGSTPQHIYGITGTYFGSLPKVTIDSTSTVTLHDRVRFGNNFTHLNSAGVTTTGSTVSFYSYYMNTLHSPTGITFNDVQIDGSGNAVIDFGGVALNVGGNFFINESYSCNLNNTTVSISGNFTSSGSYGGCLGNASFNLVGNTNTTMGASSGGTLFYFPSGNITVNKTGGASVSLSGKINANSAGQTVNLIAGSINLSGSQLYAKGLSLNGNTLYLSGGTLYINNVNTTDGTPHGGTISP